MTAEFPAEPIALYSGSTTSGIMRGGEWTPVSREDLKQMVRRGELRLMLGTDAASEGLNLQRLATLINLDLPWNPTRLEQRKGRIQRIGQVHDTVYVYNLRYKDSVEDRVHELLSGRLQGIYQLFGQIPDVLEDAWIAVAQGERERARKIIDALPRPAPVRAQVHAGRAGGLGVVPAGAGRRGEAAGVEQRGGDDHKRSDRLIRQRLATAKPPWWVVELRAGDLGQGAGLVKWHLADDVHSDARTQ